ncbi:uncharacterized protein F4822DRAFT_399287 [Hypoxylon trugodes]|uniref:uncharacterized protein n=1 Tax=Hypoxylon trugodes TaxID=326681 RepID=UPI002199CDDE|nr:uncharacterized protein F4822DRAFT_399287 [Hypoxylon trugodes]KAI1389688.1 hypothetical protein F4822DRAFT_399287 [Hypoxylon trugodes]
MRSHELCFSLFLSSIVLLHRCTHKIGGQDGKNKSLLLAGFSRRIQHSGLQPQKRTGKWRQLDKAQYNSLYQYQLYKYLCTYNLSAQ